MAFDPRSNVVHTRDGRLSPKSPTSAADVRRIVAQALAEAGAAGIVVNFHGGLVSAKDALDTASQRLYPVYAKQGGAYPLFFIWESGFLEAPFNNLAEIGGEALFREFVKKAGDWFDGHVSAHARIAARGARAPRRLSAEIERWFRTAGRRTRLPRRLREYHAAQRRVPRAILAATPLPDEDRLARRIAEDIRRDKRFQRAVREAQSGLQRPARAMRTARVSSTSLIDKEAAARLFPVSRGGPRRFSLDTWLRVAKSVAAIVLRVVRRYRDHRDHGTYITIVEEVLRELYIGRIGRSVWWDRMKGDTADAFRPGDEYGGTVFLEALRARLQGAKPPRLTLVGHSAGAIYVANFLRAAALAAPELRFEVILEAPAATHDTFARMLDENASRIADFRMFTMDDEREANDVLVPVVYPASLLYFISGLLEDEADQPLIGMQRYEDAGRYPAERFPNVEKFRAFLARDAGAAVWAPQTKPAGCRSDGKHHQDFDDNDTATLASVAYILKNGY